MIQIRLSKRAAYDALKNISFLWSGALGSALFAFLSQVVAARAFSPAEYGLFATAMSTAQLIAPLAGFGVAAFWLQVFGREGWTALRWLPVSFRFIRVSTSLAILTLSIWAVFGPHDVLTRYTLLMFASLILSNAVIELMAGKLQLEEKFGQLALWQVSQSLLRLFITLCVAMSLSGCGIIFLSAGYSIVALIIAIFGYAQLRGIMSGRFALRGHSIHASATEKNGLFNDDIGIVKMFGEVWTFGLAGVFFLIYFQSGLVIIKYFEGDLAAGIYNIAFTIIAAIYILPTTVYQKYLLPKLHRWANSDPKLFFLFYRRGSIFMLGIGIALTLAVMPFVSILVPLVFGKKYLAAIPILQILLFAVPLRFMSTSVASALLSRRNMARKVKCMGIAATVNVAVSCILIPSFGIAGAAISTVVCEAILLALFIFTVKRNVQPSSTNVLISIEKTNL